VVAVSRAVEKAGDSGSDVAGISTAASTATEKLWLFVESRQDATPEDREALPERCAEALLTHCSLSPDAVVVLDPGTLPRTSSGKLRRSTTLDRHLAGELNPPAPVNAWRLAGAMLGSSLAHARARDHGKDGGER
jgi:acyl-CoA synthetase (AMP-forming)/AMP-acid ligase II